MRNRQRAERPSPGELSKFDGMIPPMLVSNMSAKDYIDVLKESRWNSDFQMKVFKEFLGTDSIDNIIYSDHRCSIATSLVVRYILPEFIQSKGLNIDRVISIETDGEYAPSFSNIEISLNKTETRLFNGDYFISNDSQKYVIHVEEGYQDDFKFRIASKKDIVPNAHNLMEEMLKYAEDHNFLKGKKIDPACNFIKFDRTYGWDDLILPEKIKNDIRRNLQNLIEYRDIYKKNGLQVKRGLILSSAPGTGKSTLFKVLCHETKWTVLWTTPKHLENAKKVGQIIQLCKDLSPTILLLEDIDLYGGDRASNHNPALLGEMMNQLDGVQDNTDIITIATTNNKETLEKALLDRPGRFDKVIDFPLPDYDDRLQMLKIFSNGLIDENLKFLEHVAREYSKDMTGAQVKELVNMAIIFAVDGKSYDENQKIKLEEVHFKKAVETVRAKDFSKITGFNPIGDHSLLNTPVFED